MKSLAQTITILITLNLITASLSLAQPAPAPAVPAQVEAAEVDAEEVQMESAREQMEVARAQMDAAREQMERAKNTGGRAFSKLSKDIAKLRFNYGMPFSHSGTSTVLVIPTSEMKAEDLATIVEDMTVMSRIIDSQLGKEESGHIWFTGAMFGQSSMAETMYLQGYGALFLKKVDFPLSPGPAVPEEEQETKEEGVDPVWEQTKKDIFEPQEDRRRRKEQPEEKYDAEKVENLKTSVIKALKHAANIRNLKSDESVILTVTGSGDSSVITNIAIPGTGQAIVQQKGVSSVNVVTPALPIGSEFSSPTVLIIRAKKSDIDSFAKGDLDLEKFQQRVQIFTQ